MMRLRIALLLLPLHLSQAFILPARTTPSRTRTACPRHEVIVSVATIGVGAPQDGVLPAPPEDLLKMPVVVAGPSEHSDASTEDGGALQAVHQSQEPSTAASDEQAASASADSTTSGIKLDKVKNIRDLASVRGSGIKPGRLIRTGYLSKATDEDIRKLREELKLKTLIDLRSEKELLMDEDRNNKVYQGFEDWNWGRGWKRALGRVRVYRDHMSPEDVAEGRQRHFISVIDEGVYQRGVFKRLRKRNKAAAVFFLTGATMSKRVMQRARLIFLEYINKAGLPLLNELLLQYCGRALRRVLELLSDRERHPIGLYCTAGKDRTGMVVLLVLASLGVSASAIADDYVLSDTAYDDLNDEKALVGALEQNKLDPEKFLRAPRWVVEHTMNYIQEEYGGIDKYLDRVGFTADKRAKLRAALCED